MDAIAIIDKKRKALELSKEEIDFFFRSYLEDKIPDYQVSALLMAIAINGMSDLESFYLTDIFIETGEALDLSSIEGIKVDKHSTGGIGDKATLVIAPVLAACGLKICKMSGRALGYTGGTVDKLESIPGFRTDLSREEMIQETKEIGFSISSQTGNLVPLDKKVYALRDVTATVESVPLIVASIMSKKILSGADKIYIDLKVGKGALIKNTDEAKEAVDLMNRLGIRYKKEVKVGISDMNNPLGITIGNSLEVVEAIQTLQGKGGNNFSKLCTKIIVEILMMAKNITEEEALKESSECISSGKAYSKFLEMVKYQGGDLSKLKISDKTVQIKSPKTGTIVAIDALKLGVIVNSLGGGRLLKSDVIDHSVGISLNTSLGKKVEEGQNLCTVYYNKNENYEDITSAFTIFTEQEMQDFYLEYQDQ